MKQVFILAIKYEDTNDYYWHLISDNRPNTKDETKFAKPIGKELPDNITRGPFGFGDAIQLSENKVKVNREIF